MAKVTICDICGVDKAILLQVEVGRTFDGVETSSDYQSVDVCLKHAVMYARLAIERMPVDKRSEFLKRPAESK